MKIGEFLAKCNKEEIPFLLYKGNGGYKIPCVECAFFKQDKYGVYKCYSMFYEHCKTEFAEWLIEKDMPDEC